MNEQELNNQIEINDFSDELSDEVLDRSVVSFFTIFYCGCKVGQFINPEIAGNSVYQSCKINSRD